MRGSVASAPRQPGLHLGPGDRVERGERLVEREDRLAGDQGAEEGDPLSHPARELGRRGPLESGEPKALEETGRLAPGLGSAGAAVAQRQGGVVECREPGEEHVPLGHEGAGRQAVVGLGRAADRRPLRRWASGSPAISSSRVDFPHPDGPTIPSTPCGGRLELEAVDRAQIAVGVAKAANLTTPADRSHRFRRHLVGILPHSALLTKVVRKVDKHNRAGTSWTRQSSFSASASACSSA